MRKYTATLPMLASLLYCGVAHADEGSTKPIIGEKSIIRLSYRTEDTDSDGSRGTSSGHDSILERVVAVLPEGVEYEYDLPPEASKQDRQREWLLPARILRPTTGAARLLNEPELEARLDKWLASAKWTREICGRWIFTWNAFQIVCDPKKALSTVELFNLDAIQPTDGKPITIPRAQAGGIIRQISNGKAGATYEVSFAVDPLEVRKERAEADVAVGSITGKQVSLQTALEEHAKNKVSGTIRISFETDDIGKVWRRITETKLSTTKPDGKTELSERVETVERVAAHTDQ